MSLPQIHGERILVVPLDWGLGHATRCIPIIKQLLEKNKQVILGGSGSSGLLLQSVFPKLTFIDFPAYNPSYGSKINMYVSMMLQAPRFLKTIRKENTLLKEVVKEHKIDTIISDNRYGLYHTGIHTIFITHQIFIRAGIFSGMVNKKNHRYIKKYSTCWVPDFEKMEESLAGELSHGKHNLKNVRYIGPLSRFNSSTGFQQPRFKACAIISGPEPLRTQFEKQMLEEFNEQDGTFALLRGKPEDGTIEKMSGHVHVFPHLDDIAMLDLIQSSEKIICRSGYSSIMDFYAINRLNDARLVPTPGQTEQEYLAAWITKRQV